MVLVFALTDPDDQPRRASGLARGPAHAGLRANPPRDRSPQEDPQATNDLSAPQNGRHARSARANRGRGVTWKSSRITSTQNPG
jgi:hypothetical protein